MRVAYFTKQTAYKSEPVWEAFLTSCKKIGWKTDLNSMEADCALIWSVLWDGRMAKNQYVYNHYRKNKKPVFILEVGSIKRGKTWKVSIDNITSLGVYGHTSDFIPYRAQQLGVSLQDLRDNSDKPILIAGQHEKSLQWTAGTSVVDWVIEQIEKIRGYTDRPIHIRPHPRCYSRHNFDKIVGKNIIVNTPFKIPESYDEYDLYFDYHCVVNYNSGVSIRSPWHGVPIICDSSSLASEVSVPLEQIETPFIPDREQWFEKLVHTEWTIEEIEQGIPLERLLRHIDLTHTT